MSKSNPLHLHLLQGAVKAGVDESDHFKELLQGAEAAGSMNGETLRFAGFSFDKKSPDLTTTDADEQIHLSEEIPDGTCLRDEVQPGMELPVDSAPAIPETSDASLLTANIPHGFPKHVNGEKTPTPDLNKPKYAKKSGSGEEQVETKPILCDSSCVTVSIAGVDAPTVAMHQSILPHRGALHVERNDANYSKTTNVGMPADNARVSQTLPANMATVASDRVLDLALSRNRESGIDVEAEAHDVEPVLLVVPHHAPLAMANVTMADAATFQPFLLRNDRHSEVVLRSESDIAAVGPELPSQTANTEPIKRLELQWNDSSLGKILLTAELRDGVLHAVVDSSHAATSVSTADLHQFLEDNHVPVHALQVNGQSIAHQASRDTSWNFSATGVEAGMGGSQSFSHRGQEREGSSAGEQRRTHSRAERNEGAIRNVEASTVISSPQSDQRLSIHI